MDPFVMSGLVIAGLVMSGFVMAGFVMSGFVIAGFVMAGFTTSVFVMSGFVMAGLVMSGFVIAGLVMSGFSVTVADCAPGIGGTPGAATSETTMSILALGSLDVTYTVRAAIESAGTVAYTVVTGGGEAESNGGSG